MHTARKSTQTKENQDTLMSFFAFYHTRTHTLFETEAHASKTKKENPNRIDRNDTQTVEETQRKRERRERRERRGEGKMVGRHKGGVMPPPTTTTRGRS